MIRNGKHISSAQRGRQTRRHADGKYSKMIPCYAGCARRLNPDGDYCSHQLTDCRDANGEGFGDAGLIMCEPCVKACATQTTLREFIAFVRTQDPHLADVLTWAADARKAAGQ